jgi:hypothetical protein
VYNIDKSGFAVGASQSSRALVNVCKASGGSKLGVDKVFPGVAKVRCYYDTFPYCSAPVVFSAAFPIVVCKRSYPELSRRRDAKLPYVMLPPCAFYIARPIPVTHACLVFDPTSSFCIDYNAPAYPDGRMR